MTLDSLQLLQRNKRVISRKIEVTHDGAKTDQTNRGAGLPPGQPFNTVAYEAQGEFPSARKNQHDGAEVVQE